MNYLLFFPDISAKKLPETARRAGLSTVVDIGFDAIAGDNAVAGKAGLHVGWTSPTSPFVNCRPSEQEWVPSLVKNEDGTPIYWVGFWRDKPPSQSELRRPYTQPGQRVKFGAETWILPTPDSVDARAVYADDGSMRWEVTRQFAWMCDEAKDLAETYVKEFGLRRLLFDADPRVQIDWLLKLLQVNYRLTPEVAVHLDMWTGRDHIMDTFLSTIGLKRREEGSDG